MGDRLQSLDFARGLALVLMVVSHGIRLGADPLLLRHTGPLSLMGGILILTKLATPLFVLVSGFALCHVFILRRPFDLRATSVRLFRRSVLVFVAYRACVLFESIALSWSGRTAPRLVLAGAPSAPSSAWPDWLVHWWRSWGDSWSEILAFYAVIFLVAPILLWIRGRLGAGFMAAIAALVFGASLALPPFLGSAGLTAFLVGSKQSSFVPVLVYLPVFLIGMSLADAHSWCGVKRWPPVAFALLVSGALCVAVLVRGDWHRFLFLIQTDAWKYPPELPFRLFSLAMALVALGLAFALTQRAAGAVALPGRYPLFVFVFHYAALFLGLDALWGLRGRLNGSDPLLLGVGLTACVWAAVYLRQHLGKSLSG